MAAVQNLATHDVHIDISDFVNGVPCNFKSVVIPCRRRDKEDESLFIEDGVVEVDDSFLEKARQRPGIEALFKDDDNRKLRIVQSAKKKAEIQETLTGADFSVAAQKFNGKSVDEIAHDADAPISPSLGERKAAQQSSIINEKK